MSLLQMPSWDALHPLVVHFPIALLLVAPLLIVIGLALPRAGRGFLNAALVLMILGTAATWVAVATGEAAGELAPRSPAVSVALESHEELAETTRAFFTIATLAFAFLVFAPTVLHRRPRRALEISVGVVFLLGYAVGAGLLADTAHQGGQLVHRYGVHAMMPPEAGPAPTGSAGSGLLDALGAGSDEDDD